MQNRKTKLGFPHPLIRHPGETRKYLYTYPRWKPCEDRGRAPYAYEQFLNDSALVACPHILRSSMGVLPKSQELRDLCKVKLTVQPFAPCCQYIPYLYVLLVCPSCKMPLSSPENTNIIMEGYCNVCRVPVELKSYAGCRLQYQVHAPMFDCVIGSIDGRPPRYVFVLEISPLINKSEQLFLLSSNIKQLVEYGREYELAFVLVDNRVSLLTCFTCEHGEEEPLRIVINAPEEGLPISEPFLSTTRDAGKIYRLLDSLATYSYNSVYSTSICLIYGLELVIASFLNAKVMVFTCLLEESHCSGPLYWQQASVKRQTKIATLSRSLAARGLGVYLFVFDFGSMQLLEQLAPLSLNTGGSIYYYRGAERCCRQLYYDLHRVLIDPFYFDVSIRIVTSSELLSPSITSALPLVDNKLATVNPRSCFSITIEHRSLLQRPARIAVVLLYSSGGQRRMRCIQHCFGVSSNTEEVLAAIGDEAMFFGIVRDILANPQLNSRTRLEKTLQTIKPFIKAGREKSSDRNGVSIPSSLKLTCFYLTSLLKSGLFGNPSSAKPNYCYYRSYWLATLPLETLSKNLYMKLYRIDEKYQQGNYYPRNIKLEANKIYFDGIYLLDSGRFLYLVVGEDVTCERLLQIVGTAKLEEIDQLQDIPPTSHPLNLRLIATVDMLRAANLNFFLQLKSIKEGSPDYQSIIAPSLYAEDDHRRLLMNLTTP